MITRRQFAASTPQLAANPLGLGGCSQEAAADGYEAVAERTWRLGTVTDLGGAALGRELVRHATPLFTAILVRQCTRGDYDGKPQSVEELALLQRAGSSATVRLLMLTERPAMEQTLDYVMQGYTAQLANAAFVKELKAWIRFNGADAVRTRDGLYSVCTGNPNIPSWIGDLAFRWILTAKGENEKVARQVPSSVGIAVLAGLATNRAHWMETGRCYERFELQATALGIRNAFLNQPVEVAPLRPAFAAALGLGGQRPDLVVRFGRGPVMPRSLRRPVDAVMA